MVAGGRINNYEEWNISTVGILTGELGYRQFPNLPTGIDAMSLTLNNGKMLICGGWNNEKKCLQLENGTWKVHSILNNERLYHSAVTTSSATFLFGSYNSWDTYEYLPKDSTTWLPGKTGIPIGFESGCAIAVKSEKEIWLIGVGMSLGRGPAQPSLARALHNTIFKVGLPWARPIYFGPK